MSAATVTPPPRASAPPAPAVVASPPPAVGPPLYLDRLYRFTVDQCQAMLRANILEERRGVELLDGLLVVSPMIGDAHRTAVNKTGKRLNRLVADPLNSQSQNPIRLGGGSQPEPDYCIFRGSDADFAARPPGPTDLLLVVEVADSSLASDRRDKGRLYAAAGVAVYWVVNLVDGQVEVYTDPRPDADPPQYAARTDYRADGTVPLALDGVTVTVPVADLLP
jgi:Uma2 family endonuclease